MSAINRLMTRGFLPAKVHGILDYPLAAVLIAGPLALGFDDRVATVVALVFGVGATVLAVATAWSTGVVKIIPPLVHGYADVSVTFAMIVLPFALGFSGDATALVFYVLVGVGGLLATLATRFESRTFAHQPMALREAV